MVKLGDYIGLILSELTAARVQADVESLRMAEIYSSNKFLRNFAVPRVRFQNIEITTPVIIDKADEDAIEASRKPLNIPKVREHVDQVVTSNFEKAGLKLTSADQALLKKTLDEKTVSYEKAAPKPSVAVDVMSISDDLAKEVELYLLKLKEAQQPSSPSSVIKNVDINRLSQSIKIDMRARLLSLRPPLARLNVLVNTGQIKEVGPKENITLLKFTITEDAMEWITSESSSGEVKEQLVPE